MNTNIQEEIQKFSHENWWNYNSKESKMLHLLNILRMKFITSLTNVRGKNILDVGCGGGIACESLALCGASVTGIDASQKAIECAKNHKHKEMDISYHVSTIENFETNVYDVVFANDVLEHVNNPAFFLEKAGDRVKSGGLFVISTINKNPIATVFAKYVAEYVLNLVPKGTHDFKMFVKPEYIKNALPNFKHIKTQGFSFNPVSQEFFFEPTALVNYFIVLQKR